MQKCKQKYCTNVEINLYAIARIFGLKNMNEYDALVFKKSIFVLKKK